MKRDLLRYYSSAEISEMERGEKSKEYIELLRIVHSDIEGICEDITRSFAGVTLGGGIGLSQANGVDDYEPEDVLVALRDNDEKIDWKSISVDDLNKNFSSLPYFDAEGMRFHLPAFLIADLRDQYRFDLLSVIVGKVDFMCNKFALFSNAQKKSVKLYLENLLKMGDCDHMKAEIEQSIVEFWSK